MVVLPVLYRQANQSAVPTSATSISVDSKHPLPLLSAPPKSDLFTVALSRGYLTAQKILL